MSILTPDGIESIRIKIVFFNYLLLQALNKRHYLHIGLVLPGSSF